MGHHYVTIIGGEEHGYDGLVIEVEDPWPRFGTICDTMPDGKLRHFDLRPGTEPPWIADWVDPGSIPDDIISQPEPGPGQQGPEGAAGPPGPAGAEGPPGPSITYEGDWAAGTTYGVMDVVRHDDASWISLSSLNIGHEPGLEESSGNWGYVAGDGATGATGPTGAT